LLSLLFGVGGAITHLMNEYKISRSKQLKKQQKRAISYVSRYIWK